MVMELTGHDKIRYKRWQEDVAQIQGEHMLLNGTKTNPTFVPRGNNVVLEILDGEEVSAGGIHIPPKYVQCQVIAKVLAVGPGKEIPISQRAESPVITEVGPKWLEDARFENIHGIQVGDIVHFNYKHAVPTERDPKTRLCIVDADHILAVVKQGE